MANHDQQFVLENFAAPAAEEFEGAAEDEASIIAEDISARIGPSGTAFHVGPTQPVTAEMFLQANKRLRMVNAAEDFSPEEQSKEFVLHFKVAQRLAYGPVSLAILYAKLNHLTRIVETEPGQ
eukprot:Colp12_sorted_trinity150504_noHs@21284